MGAITTRCCRSAVPTRIGWKSFGVEEIVIGSSRLCAVREETAVFGICGTSTATCDTSEDPRSQGFLSGFPGSDPSSCKRIEQRHVRAERRKRFWCGPPKSERPGSTDTGSAEVIRQLTSIQPSGAKAITGALRTCPTDALRPNCLDTCAFLLPAIQTVEKWCFRTVLRLATISPEHPLYKPVQVSKNRYMKRHRTPLHAIFKHFDKDPKRIEKIPTKPRNPAERHKLPFRTGIPASKEASVAEAHAAREEYIRMDQRSMVK
jgi:hypothetical protein